MQITLLQAGDQASKVNSSDHKSLRKSIRHIQAELAAKQEQLLSLAEAAEHNDLSNELERNTPDKDAQDPALTTQEHILQNHREVRDTMSDDLLVMARNLRESQEAFSRAVVADNDLIDSTGEALEKNAQSLKRTGGKLSQYSRQSSWSCWYTLTTVVVALVAFMMTYVLILIT